jgi:hypothetical protein
VAGLAGRRERKPGNRNRRPRGTDRPQGPAGRRALKTLNERERHILIERRLKDNPTTLEDLSQQYNISRERVRQIEVRAFEKLQKAMKTRTPQARPDSQTIGRPPAAFGLFPRLADFDPLAIRSAKCRQDERHGDRGETYPRGDFLAPP